MEVCRAEVARVDHDVGEAEADAVVNDQVGPGRRPIAVVRDNLPEVGRVCRQAVALKDAAA